MSVLIPVMGTAGDWVPFLALGRGLRKQGLLVTLTGPGEAQGSVAAEGFTFLDLGTSMQQAVIETEVRWAATLRVAASTPSTLGAAVAGGPGPEGGQRALRLWHC